MIKQEAVWKKTKPNICKMRIDHNKKNSPLLTEICQSVDSWAAYTEGSHRRAWKEMSLVTVHPSNIFGLSA